MKILCMGNSAFFMDTVKITQLWIEKRKPAETVESIETPKYFVLIETDDREQYSIAEFYNEAKAQDFYQHFLDWFVDKQAPSILDADELSEAIRKDKIPPQLLTR